MFTSSRAVVAISCLFAFFAIGVPYWRIPYSQVSLPGSLYGFGLIVAAVVAASMRTMALASFRKAFVLAALTVPAAVMARVAMDGVRDPTSHNLWPFEVVIALGIGIAAAFPGALLGGVIARSG